MTCARYAYLAIDLRLVVAITWHKRAGDIVAYLHLENGRQFLVAFSESEAREFRQNVDAQLEELIAYWSAARQ